MTRADPSHSGVCATARAPSRERLPAGVLRAPWVRPIGDDRCGYTDSAGWCPGGTRVGSRSRRTTTPSSSSPVETRGEHPRRPRRRRRRARAVFRAPIFGRGVTPGRARPTRATTTGRSTTEWTIAMCVMKRERARGRNARGRRAGGDGTRRARRRRLDDSERAERR